MTIKKHWKDYFQSQSPRMTKIVNALYSSEIFLFIAVIIFGTIQRFVSVAVEEPKMDIASQSTEFVVIRYLFVILVILFILFSIAFFSAVFYNYLTIKDKIAEDKETKVNSPFIGSAIEHEKEIVDILQSVAKPLPNKGTINQAKTAKFIIALSDLGLIDSNLDSRHLMAWIENVTGYQAGETRVFNQAKKAVKVNDPDFMEYKSQIEEILSK